MWREKESPTMSRSQSVSFSELIPYKCPLEASLGFVCEVERRSGRRAGRERREDWRRV